jgi:hypothetical protein
MLYVLQQLLKNKLALFGLVMMILFCGAAVFAPVISPHPPDKQYFEGLTLEGAPLPPNKTFWLGTDLLGRSLFSRLLYGARTSLIIGIAANGAAVLIGAFLGIVAGYVKGLLGTVIMRFTDLMMAFPALLLAIALAAIFRPSLWIVALVIALVNWVQIARVIYSQTVALVEQEYIEALPGREFYLFILCRICGRHCSSGAPWVSPQPSYWRPRCLFSASVSGPRPLHGAVSFTKASLTFWTLPGWFFSPASPSCSCRYHLIWWEMR